VTVLIFFPKRFSLLPPDTQILTRGDNNDIIIGAYGESVFDVSLCLTLSATEKKQANAINHCDFVVEVDQILLISPSVPVPVLVEGILVFYYPEIRDLFHMRLFVDTDPDTRLARRVLRDVQERGRDLEFVLTQYTTFVKPAFEDFCLPVRIT
jgi:hypothetical protein